ncbi:MAG: bifunctional oligoribonuclease/PAP phosphatase NrnA [Isosphaeraceae bacterium]
MSIDWTPLADLIETHDRFLLTTHVRPDGDALGSEVGLAGLLRQKGKDVRVVNSSRTPPRYDFLDPNGTLFEHFGSMADVGASLADREVLVVLDLSAWSQLGDMAELVRGFAGQRVVIDHHVSQDDLGALFLKDTTAEATGTLIVRAIRALGGTFTPEVATGLLTAIATDTGWFRHPSTRPETFRTAAELVEAGAQVDSIYRLLFERNTAARILLMGETLAGLKLDAEGRVCYTAVTRDMLASTGAIPQDTEDLVDFTVCLEGVEVGILFVEQARGGVKVSLRSRKRLDCTRVASQFGGGGHKAAAGATLPEPTSESIARVLAAVRAELGRSPNSGH